MQCDELKQSLTPTVSDASKKCLFGTFKCSKCERTFKTRTLVKKHEEVHKPPSERTRYECTLGCGMDFATRAARCRHQRTSCKCGKRDRFFEACEECERNERVGNCEVCQEWFCRECFERVHSKGTRSGHRLKIAGLWSPELTEWIDVGNM